MYLLAPFGEHLVQRQATEHILEVDSSSVIDETGLNFCCPIWSLTAEVQGGMEWGALLGISVVNICSFLNKSLHHWKHVTFRWNKQSWNEWNLSFCQVSFISWKTHFLIITGRAFYRIWSGRLSALNIFDKMHVLLISENKFFFYEIKCDKMTSFMGFFKWSYN